MSDITNPTFSVAHRGMIETSRPDGINTATSIGSPLHSGPSVGQSTRSDLTDGISQPTDGNDGAPIGTVSSVAIAQVNGSSTDIADVFRATSMGNGHSLATPEGNELAPPVIASSEDATFGAIVPIPDNPDRISSPFVSGEVIPPLDLDNLYQKLGRSAVLLPIPIGEKAPSLLGWHNTTFQDTQNGEWQHVLQYGANVGVLLGVPSGGLVAIDIDDDEAVEPFLAANPRLRNTYRTRGSRGCQLWIRISGDYPSSSKLTMWSGGDWGEWRADGNQSVVHGIHPNGDRYSVLSDSPALELRFEELVWPDALKLPWRDDDYDKVVEREGEPYFETQSKKFIANPMFFAARFRLEHIVRYSPAQKQWLEYDGATGLWMPVHAEVIQRGVLDDLRTAAEVFEERRLLNKRNKAFAGEILEAVRVYSTFSESPARTSPVIHVANGMICTEGDQFVLKTCHPDYYSRNRSPIPYDPAAECPQFQSALLGSAMDAEDQELLQKWAGSVLMGCNPAQRILLITGTAGGGKSSVMSVIEKVIGLQNVAALRTEALNERFEFSAFIGKTLLTGKDVNAEFLMSTGATALKRLVGDDYVEAELKYAGRVPVRGDFNVAITCNSNLTVRLEGDEDAWRRRLMVIHYDRPAPSRPIPDLANKLIAEEGPGILRWMVEGAMMLQDDLRTTGRFRLTAAQEERVNQLLGESDSCRLFVRDAVRRVEGATVTENELVGHYIDYCSKRGWTTLRSPDAKKKFRELLLKEHRSQERNDIQRNGADQRGFKHVTVDVGVCK